MTQFLHSSLDPYTDVACFNLVRLMPNLTLVSCFLSSIVKNEIPINCDQMNHLKPDEECNPPTLNGKKREWEDTVVLDLSRTRKLILMKPNFISREIVKNFLRKKVTFIRLQFVGCQSILAKATLGNGSYAETKRCGNRKLIQFFLLFQKKKSILGRYINTLFFYYKRHKWFPHFKNVMLMFFFLPR